MTATTILADLTTRGVRVWAEADRLKLDAPAGILTDDDKAQLAAHKAELLALLSGLGVCPDCAGEMKLQDRATDAGFCPNCRTWCDGQGRALARIEKPKPITRDADDARRLIEDLQRVGCGFVCDNEELRITNLSRINAALLVRVEQAGEEFKRLAREAAERGKDDFGDERLHEWTM